MICEEVTEEGVQTALTALPNDLNDVCMQMFVRIRAHKTPRVAIMGEMALTLVLFATEPRYPETVIDAITFSSTADNMILPALLDICRGLVVLDEGLKVLRFAHFSVQEFLLKQIPSEEGNAAVAAVALKLLLFSSSNPPPHSFYMYATENWPIHVRESGTRSNSLCAEFLSSCIPYETWSSTVGSWCRALRPGESCILSPLFVACFYNLAVIVELLLQSEIDLDITNGVGETPLHVVARKGNWQITRLLLEQGANTDCRNGYGRTPLSYAASNGHVAVVEIRLKHEIEVDSRDNSGQTSLSWAVCLGKQDTMQLLLNHGVEVESKDNSGRTALSWAAFSEQQDAVQILLQHGANVVSKDNSGRTPLSYAACSGHMAVIKMLLEHDVEVDSRDKSGRTALSWAAQEGYQGVVQILLQQRANVESRDNSRRTPLS